MAVNIVITGNIYDELGSLFTGNEVKYQPYFYNAVGGGSSSTWGNVRSSAFGQYNFNLADADLLTSSGEVSNGDVVLVVFWTPNTADRMDSCSSLTSWSILRIILGTGPGMSGVSLYANDVQVKSNICPNLIWSLVDNGLVGVSYTANNNSTDIHQWDFGGVTLHQRDSWYSTTLMSINNIDNSTYDWGDTNVDVESGTINGVHDWTAAGDYDVEIVIEDDCGCTVTGTDSIRIKYNPPVPNIVMNPAVPDPNEPVDFDYTGTDPNDRITSIEWTINDSGVYGNTNTTTTVNRDDNVPHTAGTGTDWHGESPASGAFTNPGNHLVSIVVHWNDGFDDLTINYSETFNQGRFTGPTIDFTQDPAQAAVASGVKFVNTSINTDRVGLGLPDHTEYDWTFTDDGVPTQELDKPFSYELEVTPTSANCQVELCADWSDGWDTQTTCESKSVTFETTVTVSPIECYYNLNIIGTSSDGTVSGYSWTVASGTSETGPWTDIWDSPTGMDQNDKKVNFPAIGWYKITGYVYGTGATTSDSETLFVDSVCPASEAIYDIWNGTGLLDIGGDWTHHGKGTETPESKYSGTNGLDATGLKKNNKITFDTPGGTIVDISPYDMLALYVNVREWTSNTDMEVELKGVVSEKGTVNLSKYVNFSTPQQWQKVYIPLADFGLASPYATRIRFTATGNMGLWMDDLEFNMGALVYTPICEPDMTANEVGTKATYAKEVTPSMKAIMDLQPSARTIKTFPRPINI